WSPGRALPAQNEDATSPSRSNNSGLRSVTPPAKAEYDWYGEFPAPVGPSGRICHHICRMAASVSTQRYVVGPRSPTPNGPGRLVGCSRTPADRGSVGVVTGALVARRGRRQTSRKKAQEAQKEAEEEDRRSSSRHCLLSSF